MTRTVLVGYFAEEEDILRAVQAARCAGLQVHDAYTPYAVHGMDEALGLRPSRLTWVCFVAGLLGLIGAMGFMLYTSTVSWPLNVGGKPFASIPAYIPVAFEVTVLCAGLSTVAALFWRAKLIPTTAQPALPGVTDDRFALALVPGGDRYDPINAQALLRANGAIETRLEEVS